jgi:hypothetical protein
MSVYASGLKPLGVPLFAWTVAECEIPKNNEKGIEKE